VTIIILLLNRVFSGKTQIFAHPSSSRLIGRAGDTSLEEDTVTEEITQKLWWICIWLALKPSAQPPKSKTRSPKDIG